MSDPHCAVGPDSKVLDTVQILWFNDLDNVNPMASPSQYSSSESSSSVSAPRNALNVLNTAGCLPAALVAGSHCSNHVGQPSKKVLKSASMKLTGKCKAQTRQRCLVSCKQSASSIPEHHTDGSNEPTDNENSLPCQRSQPFAVTSNDMEANTAHADNDLDEGFSYKELKEMSVADEVSPLVLDVSFHKIPNARKAASVHSKSECTADVHTIVVKVKDEKNPDTGKLQNGHNCAVCMYVKFFL